MSRDGFSARNPLLALAAFWTVGIAMLVGSLFGSVDVDRFQHAPTCSTVQVFTPAQCRIVVDATLTGLNREQVVMDVDGRHVTAEVKLHGELPANVAGLPVRVTFYRGVVVHVEGGELNFDTDAAPVDSVDDFRFGGLFFLIGGTFLVGAGTLIRSARPTGSR